MRLPKYSDMNLSTLGGVQESRSGLGYSLKSASLSSLVRQFLMCLSKYSLIGEEALAVPSLALTKCAGSKQDGPAMLDSELESILWCLVGLSWGLANTLFLLHLDWSWSLSLLDAYEDPPSDSEFRVFGRDDPFPFRGRDDPFLFRGPPKEAVNPFLLGPPKEAANPPLLGPPEEAVDPCWSALVWGVRLALGAPPEPTALRLRALLVPDLDDS